MAQLVPATLVPSTLAPSTLLASGPGVTAPPVIPFPNPAVYFDGTNDYLKKITELTGAVDGKEATISFWFKLHSSGEGITRNVFSHEQNRTRVYINTANKIQAFMTDVNGGAVSIFSGSTVLTDYTSFHHCLIAYNTATGMQDIYIDDVAETVNSTANINANVERTQGQFQVGARGNTGVQPFNGCLSDFYYNIATALDFSIEANRRKFILADLQPADLGAGGINPTGVVPIVFDTGDKTAFVTNSGSGGGFTEVGALEDCV